MTQPQYTDRQDAKARAKAEKAYQKAQRPWFKKKRFIIPLALVVLFVIIGIAGGGGDSATVTPGGSEAAPAGPPAFPGATPKDVVAKAGAAVNADGLTVTTGPIVPGDAVGGPTLCASVTYQNGRKEPVDFNGGFDWKLQDPNGTILMTTLLGSDDLLQAGQIAPGGRAAGDVCFSAPKKKLPGQYVVLYDPSFRFTSDRIAWLNQR